MRKCDTYELSVEIDGVSAIITGLANQFGNDSDRLTDDYMEKALLGISKYLDRISEDIERLETE